MYQRYNKNVKVSSSDLRFIISLDVHSGCHLKKLSILSELHLGNFAAAVVS
jgi:hypothetical protein